jgi:hypothetical protein
MGFLAFWSVSPVRSAAGQVTWTGLLVAGTKYRGEFEVRLKKLMEEIKQNEDIILFID